MIITCKKKFPLHWLLLTIMLWSSWMFVMATLCPVRGESLNIRNLWPVSTLMF